MKTCPLCDTGYPNHKTNCDKDGALLIESRELEPGTVIRGKYRVVRLLGHGGMGTVYLAEHILLGQHRALKFISSELSQDSRFLKRFRHEAQAAIKLRHPNVVEVVDLDQAEDGSPYIAMEYVEGEDLRHVLAASHPQNDCHPERTPSEIRAQSNDCHPERSAAESKDLRLPFVAFPVERALAIARGIAQGLGAAHAKGIVHRDVKPENILLAGGNGAPETPKLLDFGIAAIQESATAVTRTRGLMLTPPYAAPEQWQGMASEQLDGRADLYALGGVLYEMLTGQTCFHAHNTEGWMHQHLHEEPQPPSRLRPELADWKGLDALVLRVLAKDREDRPRDAAELVGLLDAVRFVNPGAHRGTVAEHPRSKVTELLRAKSFRRMPRWARLASVALLVVAVITAGLAVSLPTSAITAVGLRFDRPHHHSFVIPFYRLACARGDSNACCKAGDDYEGTPAGNVLAIGYLSKACDLGNAKGCSSLGEDYDFGFFAAKDYSRAEVFYSKACEMGDTEGCDGLTSHGSDYVRGRDFSRAEDLFSKACAAGNALGCDELSGVGYDYEIGMDGKRDILRAAALYSKACDAGSAEGCRNLGDLYLDGNGFKQDFHHALALISKACNEGDDIGCWDEGHIYLSGWGLAKDKEKARKLFTKSCAMGLKDACDDARNPRHLPLK